MRNDAGYDASSELPELYDHIPLYNRRPDMEFYDGSAGKREQVNDIEMIWRRNGRRTVRCFPMRYFFRFEAEHLLALVGFEVTALYGAFDGSPFTDGSAEMIFTARA